MGRVGVEVAGPGLVPADLDIGPRLPVDKVRGGGHANGDPLISCGGDSSGGGGGSGYTSGSVTVVSSTLGGSSGDARIVLREV